MNAFHFKYMTVNSPERLESLLTESKLWFPSPTCFNDPNEFRFHLRAPKQKSIIRKQYFADHSEAVEEDFESWYRMVSWKSWPQYQEGFIRRDLSSLGVLCLSTTCRNPIMWAHYADGHAGICVAFNSGFLAEVDNLILAESVLYRKRLPRVKYFGEDRTEVIRKLVLTKYSDWAYEREFRVITSHGNTAKQIAQTSIDGIILGTNISREKEDRILGIIGKRQSPIKVFRARLSYLTYEMEITNFGSNGSSHAEIVDYL